MKKATEMEFEVLPKESKGTSLQGDDPLIALISRLMDTVFTVPGTKIRFGLDPLIGLLPGLGDTASAIISMLLIMQSARHGVPKVVLARMALNVLINATLGALPVAGDLFSFWFKSNVKNYDLLRKHAGAGRPSTTRDWIFVIALLSALIVVVGLLLVGTATLLSKALGH